MKKVLGALFTLILIFVVSFFFWGSSHTESPSLYNELSNSEVSTSANDTFSIITYNIGYLSGMTNNKAIDRSKDLFDDNLNASASLFNELQPDFIAFQEIDFDSDRSFNVNQMEELSQQTQLSSWAKAVNWDKQYVPFPYLPVSQQFGKIVSGQAVLSNQHILQNEIQGLVKPEANPFYYNAFYLDRLAQVTKVNYKGLSYSSKASFLVIINVHLEAFHADTRDIQINTVLNMYDSYAKDYPVILCGDFNSTPPGATNPWQDDHVIETILNHTGIEMAIGMDENNEREADYFTFNSENPDKRIDYFFYNPNLIEVLDTRVLVEAKQISDHLPVWMKFVIKK